MPAVLGLPAAPLLLGFMLGLIPISPSFMLTAIVLLAWSLWSTYRSTRRAAL